MTIVVENQHIVTTPMVIIVMQFVERIMMIKEKKVKKHA